MNVRDRDNVLIGGLPAEMFLQRPVRIKEPRGQAQHAVVGKLTAVDPRKRKGYLEFGREAQMKNGWFDLSHVRPYWSANPDLKAKLDEQRGNPSIEVGDELDSSEEDTVDETPDICVTPPPPSPEDFMLTQPAEDDPVVPQEEPEDTIVEPEEDEKTEVESPKESMFDLVLRFTGQAALRTDWQKDHSELVAVLKEREKLLLEFKQLQSRLKENSDMLGLVSEVLASSGVMVQVVQKADCADITGVASSGSGHVEVTPQEQAGEPASKASRKPRGNPGKVRTWSMELAEEKSPSYLKPRYWVPDEVLLSVVTRFAQNKSISTRYLFSRTGLPPSVISAISKKDRAALHRFTTERLEEHGINITIHRAKGGWMFFWRKKS